MDKVMLVTDYDGTLDDGIIHFNIKAINRFRENGNLLTIATANSFNHMQNELINKGINPNFYDYLITSNGRTIFNCDNAMISGTYISDYIMKVIDDVTYLFDNIIVNSYNPFGDKDNKNILFVHLFIKNIFIKQKVKEYLKQISGIKIYEDLFNIYIYMQVIDKVDAIETLRQEENIPITNIYTVGNGKNDIPMLKHYNGYSMLLSRLKCYQNSLGITTSVRSLIKKIETNKAQKR